jgi:hypothetical protein
LSCERKLVAAMLIMDMAAAHFAGFLDFLEHHLTL